MNCFEDFKLEFTNIKATDMPDKEYFAVPALSTSKIKLLDSTRGGSIEKFEAGFQGGYSPALELGSAIHNAILSPDEYIISDYVAPVSAKLKFFIECLAKYRKDPKTRKNAIELASQEADYYVGKMTDKIKLNAWQKGKEYYRLLMLDVFDPYYNDDKVVTVLDEKLHTAWKESVTNLKKDFMFRSLMTSDPFEEPKEIINEMAFFCDLVVTFPDGYKMTIPYKGKADNIILDHEHKICYLNDIKTTSKGIGYFMPKVVDGVCYSGTFEHHDYYMQLGNYMVMVQMWMRFIRNLLDYSYKSCILGVETTCEHKAQVFPISNSYIQEGIKEFKRLICEYAYYKRYGVQYTDGCNTGDSADTKSGQLSPEA